ncbi:MAG: urease accessory protein UreE [Proteobacteria bacterium]|nr:urease accessory protein UreE [Pseudomonadota bacterium]
MLLATSVRAAGDWSGDVADLVMLDFEGRNARTAKLIGMRGNVVEIALDRPVTVRTGDAFVTADGRFVEVLGKPEPLMDILPASEADLARIAWQLGNHHLPMQLAGKRIRIRPDAAIAAILTEGGAKVTNVEAPFDPEGGAYLTATTKAHAHGHHHHGPDCGCDHDHGHGHAHDHHHAHDHQHDHAHGKGHDHVHDHKDDHDHKHDGSCCGGHGHHHGHKHD